MLVRCTLLLLAVVAASPALAFDTGKLGQWGSLGLEEIMPLIDKSPPLKREVTEALEKANRKADDIRCEGARFPGAWRGLGGERAAPYACNIGDRWLEIRATVRVTGRRGKVFDKVTPDAMKNATTKTETNPTGTWSEKDPRAPKAE
jgi:hypothetical protein